MKLYKLPIDDIIDQLGYRGSNNLFFHNQFENSSLSPHSKRI